MIFSHQLRQKYLDYFEDKDHVVVPSSPLLPENDPTTLFTGSGMQPMITYLLGAKHPSGTRIVDSQKCFRAEDIEEVGDNRHTTFFEMLGNWSLGDYFKREQIRWMFEFLTKELRLDPKRIYVSVFRGNDEFGILRDEDAVDLWKEQFKNAGIDAVAVDFAETRGMQDGRIFYYPDKKNWWSRPGVPLNMPVGEPGGPDSEMFWDFGEHLKLHERSQWKDELCHVNCDCGRFMEIGNNVFMMYVKKSEKSFAELPNKNIDFGGGLERIAAALHDDPDMFLIDVFVPIREVIERLSGKTYGGHSEETRAFRVIMDHLRAATFLIGDNAKPSNKDQGYFTRRLIRRSIRFAHRLGIVGNFCAEIARVVINEYKEAYPNLVADTEMIVQEMEREEEQFRKTLEKGLKEFERHACSGVTELDGKAAFDLYQTYGFPLELTQEVAKERKISLNRDFEKIFKEELQKHQELSRVGAEQKFKGGLADHSEATTKLHTAHHLLLKALQLVLGPHVKQRGSNITGQRLRIDFSHGQKLTPGQLKRVEEMVNQKISEDLPVIRSVIAKEKAEKLGAEHEFNAKYPDMVSVYSVGPKEATQGNPQFGAAYSLEFCGGPHTERTGVIGKFKILKEEASSAGVRRIKAVVR
jgi:alanyl-tRNA synthetase